MKRIKRKELPIPAAGTGLYAMEKLILPWWKKILNWITDKLAWLPAKFYTHLISGLFERFHLARREKDDGEK